MEKYFSINQKNMSVKCKIYCENPRAVERVVLSGHGFGGHKDNRAAEKLYNRLQKRNKNIALITFNWPGHGDDASPQLRLEGCDRYLTAVLDYIRTELHTEEIYGSANSFGGYLFLKYIYEHGSPFVKTVLRSPAVNIYQSLRERIMNASELEEIEKGRTALVGFDRKIRVSAEFLNDLKEADITTWDFSPFADDIFIIHGDRDEIIDCEASWMFAEENGIGFYIEEGADHRCTDPLKMDDAIKQTVQFFGLR